MDTNINTIYDIDNQAKQDIYGELLIPDKKNQKVNNNINKANLLYSKGGSKYDDNNDIVRIESLRLTDNDTHLDDVDIGLKQSIILNSNFNNDINQVNDNEMMLLAKKRIIDKIKPKNNLVLLNDLTNEIKLRLSKR